MMYEQERVRGGDERLRRFEAQIFNRKVRALLESGEPNDTGFDNAWADGRFVGIWARSLTEALALFDREYPTSAGFTIVGIIELPDE